MTGTRREAPRKGKVPVLAVAGLLALSAFMYASIMYKIIKFGP